MCDSMIQTMKQARSLLFLTGAGVSTHSGIPDYRSLQGIYTGVNQPEYLLSNRCLIKEPSLFYSFVKQLYHPNAKPNVIHRAMKELENQMDVCILSQNIDGLHKKAKSKNVINFHGSLEEIYCLKCGEYVPVADYLLSDKHIGCSGQLRPGIVLYGEGFSNEIMDRSIREIQKADVIVIVGSSFQVHPFCDLIYYRKKQAKLMVVNQTPVHLEEAHERFLGDAANFFTKLMKK